MEWNEVCNVGFIKLMTSTQHSLAMKKTGFRLILTIILGMKCVFKLT